MANPVVHFEIVGKDPLALQAFYKSAFDWTIGPPMAEMGNYAMVEAPSEDDIGGGIGGSMDGSPGHVTFYVSVPDVGAALAKIEKLGGKTVMPPMPVPGGATIAMFTDPEGHAIGLYKPA
jgi:predicted enzyme related to lactoylglutathione lyase